MRDQGARTYVTPILIHGGFPAVNARDLVQLIDAELCQGLVDGLEARSRLLRRSDLDQLIGRPGRRLFTYAPEYADQLLEAVIDYLTLPPARRRHLLPAHLERALADAPVAPHHSRKRLRPPEIVLELWSGIGPQVVGRDQHLAWTLERNGKVVRIEADECVELDPNDSVLARGGGRRVQLWTPRQVAFFDGTGLLLPDGAPLPVDCIVLHDRSCRLRAGSGGPPRVAVEAAPLSGRWSRFTAYQLDLTDATTLEVHQETDYSLRRTVAAAYDVTIVGDPVPWTTGPAGDAVFAVPPLLRWRPDESVPVWFTPDGGSTVFQVLSADADGMVDLGAVIGAFAGRLDFRAPDGRRVSRHLTVVPGLRIEMPERVLAPGDTTTVIVHLASGRVNGPPVRTIGGMEHDVALEVCGTNRFTVLAHLPRVRWGLRTDDLARINIASRVLQARREDLVENVHYLIVRHGRPARVRLDLVIDDQEHQRLDARTMPAEPGVYSCAFDLTRMRDTFRYAPSRSTIELQLRLGDTTICAVACGIAGSADRSWSPPPDKPPVPADWSDLPWDIGSPDTDDADVRELRKLQRSDQVVRFLELFATKLSTWQQHGVEQESWDHLRKLADALWHTEGVRYRWFNGRDLSRLRPWAVHARQVLDKFPAGRRDDLTS